MESAKWPVEWLRGILAPAVLSIVSEGETYGYLIAQGLAERGLGLIKGGTLYPLLARLEQEGYLVASWSEGAKGPGRKYYMVTETGRERLAMVRAEWPLFAQCAAAAVLGERKTA